MIKRFSLPFFFVKCMNPRFILLVEVECKIELVYQLYLKQFKIKKGEGNLVYKYDQETYKTTVFIHVIKVPELKIKVKKETPFK